MNKFTLTEVPSHFLQKVNNASFYVPVLYQELSKSKIPDWKVIKYIDGWLTYQQQIESDDSKQLPFSKMFKAKIVDVKIIERRTSDDKLVGTKAEIVFEAKNQKGKITEQSITTGFLSYAFNPANHIFEIAQANTIATLAEKNIGAEAMFRKVVIPEDSLAEGDKVRYLGDLYIFKKSEDDSSDSANKNSGSEDSVEEDVFLWLDDAIDAGDVKFTGEQLDCVEDSLYAFLEHNSVAKAVDSLVELEDFQFVDERYIEGESPLEIAKSIVNEAYNSLSEQ